MNKDSGGVRGKLGIDCHDLLSPEDFSWFLKLKEVRMALAEAAGIPVYTVFPTKYGH